MSKTLLYQNKKIFYRKTGSGKPVVLIHGFGEDGDIWQTQVDYLKEKFMLIVPDLPGSGNSELIDDMSVEGMAEVIKSIIDIESSVQGNNFELPGSKVPLSGGFRGALIGHSMGGYIALAFAEKYSHCLNALGLFHSTAYADSEEKKATRRKGIQFIEQHGAFEFLKTSIPNLFAPNSKIQIPDSIAELIDQGHNFSPPALVSYYEAMINRPDRSNLLQNSTVPILFLMGKYDHAVPLEDVLKQCHLPEKSYIHILRNSGHMGMMEEPETSCHIMEKFLMDA